MRKITKMTFSTAYDAFVFGGMAWAGTLDPIPVEQPVYAPLPPVAVSGDWNGF